jgi:hypothetical protein
LQSRQTRLLHGAERNGRSVEVMILDMLPPPGPVRSVCLLSWSSPQPNNLTRPHAPHGLTLQASSFKSFNVQRSTFNPCARSTPPHTSCAGSAPPTLHAASTPPRAGSTSPAPEHCVNAPGPCVLGRCPRPSTLGQRPWPLCSGSMPPLRAASASAAPASACKCPPEGIISCSF